MAKQKKSEKLREQWNEALDNYQDLVNADATDEEIDAAGEKVDKLESAFKEAELAEHEEESQQASQEKERAKKPRSKVARDARVGDNLTVTQCIEWGRRMDRIKMEKIAAEKEANANAAAVIAAIAEQGASKKSA